ncbi:MAG TPA: hypothetical protein VGC75_05230 [Candidatus Nitrosocosmicus sp.]
MVSSPLLKNLLHRKLLARLTIPIVISLVMLVILIDDLLYTPIPLSNFAWIFAGFIIGYPFGRLTKISWNSDKTQLILLGSGIVLLMLYVVIRIVTTIIIRIEFGHLSYVLDITLLISIGGTIGKTLGTIKQIRLAISTG